MNAEFLIPLVVFGAFAFVVKVISDNNVRRKAIDKGLAGDDVMNLFTETLPMHAPSSFKWGLVLIGLGLAITIGQLVPSEMEEVVTAAAMFIFAGVALLLFYHLANKKSQ